MDPETRAVIKAARKERRRQRRAAERALFESWYAELDPESQGVLQIAYITKKLKKHGYSDADIELLLKEAEAQGVMDIEGFVKFMETAEIDHEAAKIRAAAEEYVTEEQLLALVKEHVPDLTEEQYLLLLKEVAREEDGRIRLELFMEKLKALA